VETAESLKDLALVNHWMGDIDKAAVFYRKAIDLYRSLDTASASYSEALNDYGTLLMDQGSYAEAEQLFREAFGMSTAILGETHMMVASNLVNLGLVRHWQLDVDAADSLYHQALAMQTSLVGDDHIEIAYTLNNLGWVYLDRNDFEVADSLFRRSLAIREKSLGDSHPSVALAMNNLATLVYFPKEEYQEAEALLEKALEISRTSIPGNHPTTAIVLNSLARLRERQGTETAAEPLFREATEMRTALFGAESAISARSSFEWAGCLIRLKRFQQAEAILLSAYKTLLDEGLKDEARSNLSVLYEAWGRPDEEAAMRIGESDSDATGASVQ
jgi:tetratricopeptide (TPR) repeat protein